MAILRFVVVVALLLLRPWSTGMVMSRRSVNIAKLFLGRLIPP